jgi:hypothetical protein
MIIFDRLVDRHHVDVAHRDLGAFLGELQRGGLADALRGTGDDRNLVCETHEFPLQFGAAARGKIPGEAAKPD